MARCVLLLRGINVGGRRKVAMAQLRALLTDAGFQDVATYVQSGNIVLSSDADPATLCGEVAGLIGDRFGFEVPVCARTAPQLERVLACDPLPDAARDPKRYVVTFLADAPSAVALERLRELAIEDERLHATGRELYTHHPQGQARSKLAAALTGAALGPTATARNWTTVTTLSQMARG